MSNDADPQPVGTDPQPGAAAASPPVSAKRIASRSFVAALVVGMGVLAGLGTFTFGYGKGASYLSNNPAGCANCHVMQDHLESWQHSSHHHVAVCNDCHLPHHFVGKWVTKADNGLLHSMAFTLDNFHEPIEIKPRNRRVTQSTCVSCHQDFVHGLLPPGGGDGAGAAAQEPVSCVHCHKNVGHAYRTP